MGSEKVITESYVFNAFHLVTKVLQNKSGYMCILRQFLMVFQLLIHTSFLFYLCLYEYIWTYHITPWSTPLTNIGTCILHTRPENSFNIYLYVSKQALVAIKPCSNSYRTFKAFEFDSQSLMASFWSPFLMNHTQCVNAHEYRADCLAI